MAPSVAAKDLEAKTNGRHACSAASTAEAREPAADATSSNAMSQRVQALKLDKSHISPGGKPRRRWRRLILLVLLVAGCVAGVGVQEQATTWFNQLRGASAMPEVDTVLVTSEEAADFVLDTTGYVMAGRIIQVNPRIPGTVVELPVEEGDRIAQGDVLARLDRQQYLSEVNQMKAGLELARANFEELESGAREQDIRKAEAALEEAQSMLELAESNLRRAETLKDTIAPAEYDRMRSNRAQAASRVEQLSQTLELLKRGARKERLAAAAAEVERAKALLAKAEYYDNNTTIRATVSGTLLKCSVDCGESVRPESMTGAMFTIADLNQLEAEIDIQERDTPRIKIGQSCLITTEAYPEREYTGRVCWLAPMYNRQRGVRQARVEFLEADERLAPDMNCRVRILKDATAEQASVLRVPHDAVAEEAGESFVFVLDGQTARRRAMELGDTVDEKVEVRSGLAEGDVVILPGGLSLDDGQIVRPRTRDDGDKQ